jgi:hypothetical protein
MEFVEAAHPSDAAKRALVVIGAVTLVSLTVGLLVHYTYTRPRVDEVANQPSGASNKVKAIKERAAKTKLQADALLTKVLA